MGALPRYLGLDISTYTGWAIAEGDQLIGSGIRDFSVKKSEHVGKRGIMFYNFLLSIGRVDEIYFEQIAFGGGFKDKKSGRWINATNDGRELYHGLLMIVYMYAAGYGIPTFPMHPSTLKKDYAGHGRAEKEDMCKVAHSKGWRGGEKGTALCHDEVDAIALLDTQLLQKYNIQLKY